MNNRCVSCGEIIPESREGRMVCSLCEHQQIKIGMILQSNHATDKEVSKAYDFIVGNNGKRD